MSGEHTGILSETAGGVIDVTPEMVEAGYGVLRDGYGLLREDVHPEELKNALKAVFRAMWLARRTATPAS